MLNLPTDRYINSKNILGDPARSGAAFTVGTLRNSVTVKVHWVLMQGTQLVSCENPPCAHAQYLSLSLTHTKSNYEIQASTNTNESQASWAHRSVLQTWELLELSQNITELQTSNKKCRMYYAARKVDMSITSHHHHHDLRRVTVFRGILLAGNNETTAACPSSVHLRKKFSFRSRTIRPQREIRIQLDPLNGSVRLLV